MIFNLPIRDLIVNRDMRENERGIIQTAQSEVDPPRVLVDWNEGIDIRVEWDGRDESPGRFEALASGDWTPLTHIEPSVENPMMVTENAVTKVRVARGSLHPSIRFAAKMIPIDWTKKPAFEDHDLIVTRGTDYDYAGTASPETTPWVDSALQNGVHCLVLDDIVVGQDYEMWIRLWHPTNPDLFKDQDPIIRTDPSDPYPPS